MEEDLVFKSDPVDEFLAVSASGIKLYRESNDRKHTLSKINEEVERALSVLRNMINKNINELSKTKHSRANIEGKICKLKESFWFFCGGKKRITECNQCLIELKSAESILNTNLEVLEGKIKEIELKKTALDQQESKDRWEIFKWRRENAPELLIAFALVVEKFGSLDKAIEPLKAAGVCEEILRWLIDTFNSAANASDKKSMRERVRTINNEFKTEKPRLEPERPEETIARHVQAARDKAQAMLLQELERQERERNQTRSDRGR
jgi:hypothetical protein